MQFEINKHEQIFSKTTKIARAHRASSICSLKKFTSAYLLQIAQEKSCDYLLITYMKKFEMVKQKKGTHITQSGKNCFIKLRHSWRALDLKAKDLIGSFKNRIVY